MKTFCFLLEMPNNTRIVCFTYADIHRITGIALATLSKYLTRSNTLVIKNFKIERLPIIRDQRGRLPTVPPTV